MQAKFYNQAPPTLVALAVFAFLLLLLGRESFFEEDLPAFLPSNDNFIRIELSGEGAVPGIYQINDAMPLEAVINLAGVTISQELLPPSIRESPLQDGESIKVIENIAENKSISRGWMSASHRVSMGIPLHPDRMNYDDWQFLPGIGEALAGRIALDRQKNGEFARLEGLARVPGIGLKSIKKWRVFFPGM